MNLTELLQYKELNNTIEYYIEGRHVVFNVKDDCTINNNDETAQIKGVSYRVFAYGDILNKVIEAKDLLLLKIKNFEYESAVELDKLESLSYLRNQMQLEVLKARVTEKVLESLVNADNELCSKKIELNDMKDEMKKEIVKYELTENTLKLIKIALQLKQEALVEIIRRRNLELKNLNHFE